MVCKAKYGHFSSAVSHLCSHETPEGLGCNPVQQELGRIPGGFAALKKGWKTVEYNRSLEMWWLQSVSADCALAFSQNLVKLFSNYIKWVCLNELRVIFELKDTSFLGHQ